MEQHTCRTYLAVWFPFDREKNAAAIKERRDCTIEELGILNRDEVGQYLIQEFGVNPEWNRHHFVIGCNENYDVNVNNMLRITLKDFFGKEEKLKDMCEKFGVTAMLEIVPQIVADSEEVHQYLSLERDIIEFLYKSGTSLDLDYYVI